jgi:ABC-type phosphate/phosphonate transport system substrate-binding protein
MFVSSYLPDMRNHDKHEAPGRNGHVKTILMELVNPLLFAVSILLTIALPSGGQPTEPSDGRDTTDSPPMTEVPLPPSPSGNLFRIAHVRTDAENPIATEALDRLRIELAGTEAIRVAMDQTEIADIVIQTADTYQNLIDAMNRNEPDLVFCTSVAFVTQTGEYDVLFQIRRPRDFFSNRGDRILQRGALIVGNRSPLFQASDPMSMLPQALERGAVAMVGSHSAVGYVYPSLLLRITHPDARQSHPPAFLGSSNEVVKAVLSGTAEIGACDASAIKSVLESHQLSPLQMNLLKVITSTEPIPTDPVVLRTRWRPGTPGGSPPARLGREIRDGLRRFFHRQPDMPRLEPAKGERYQDVAEALDKLRESQDRGRPVLPPTAR